MKVTFTLSFPLEESSDEHNSWEAAGRLIKNVFVRIDYTQTNFVQIDDHRTRRRRRNDSSEREGRTEKNSIWIMHGSREGEEGPTEAQGKERTLFRTHVSLFLLFHSLVSGREVHEDAPDAWSFFSSCPVLSLSLSFLYVMSVYFVTVRVGEFNTPDKTRSQSTVSLFDSLGDSVGERKVSVLCPVISCP